VNDFVFQTWGEQNFLKIVVAFPTVPAGKDHKVEALLAVLDELCAELGQVDRGSELSPALSRLGDDHGALSPENERWVAAMRQRLAKLAASVGAGTQPMGHQQRAVCFALDGAELVMRGELVTGNAGKLHELVPSFVFLVVLPIVDQDQALTLSRRTSELMARGLPG
jgi:hypothetical protein